MVRTLLNYLIGTYILEYLKAEMNQKLIFISRNGFKKADAKSTTSYFLGPTFIGIIISLSDLNKKN